MNNKAQGLSLNTIVIAIIVLIVLVTLIAVFVGALGLFTKDITKDCTNKGGDFVPNRTSTVLPVTRFSTLW